MVITFQWTCMLVDSLFFVIGETGVLEIIGCGSQLIAFLHHLGCHVHFVDVCMLDFHHLANVTVLHIWQGIWQSPWKNENRQCCIAYMAL